MKIGNLFILSIIWIAVSSCSIEREGCENGSHRYTGYVYSDSLEFFLFIKNNPYPYYYQLPDSGIYYKELDNIFKKGVGYRNGAEIHFCGKIKNDEKEGKDIQRKTIIVDRLSIIREIRMDKMIDSFYESEGLDLKKLKK